jgi:hypothetical protein
MKPRTDRVRAAPAAPAIVARSLRLPAGSLGVLAGMLLLAAPARAALSPSAYSVRALCSAPTPGHAGCLGLRLVAKVPMSVPGARAVHMAGPSTPGSAPLAAEPARGLGRATSPSATGSPLAAIEYTKPLAKGLTPGNLLTAYDLPVTPQSASSQTIGIVNAYDDEKAEQDLATYDQQFGLPACSQENGCFRKVNQQGNPAPLPPSKGAEERGWAQEIATDVEVSHSVCNNCHVVLVEAESSGYADLEAAEETAVKLGATEISNSWGGEEPGADSQAFNHPGVVITASSGDGGYLNWLEGPASRFAVYPASSPHVVAVGGTRLSRSAGGTWEDETVWNDGGTSPLGELEGDGAGGGGCSVPFTAPPWQQSVSDWSSVGCGTKRAVADISADADPYTGVAVYDSTEAPGGGKGWWIVGGTSVASPIVASAFALAGGAHGVAYPARTLYENEVEAPGSLHDVVSGSNGACSEPFSWETAIAGCTSASEAESCSLTAICLAGPGYDGPSGVGTPNGLSAFQPRGLSEGGEEGSANTGGNSGGGGAGGGGGGQGSGSSNGEGAGSSAPGSATPGSSGNAPGPATPRSSSGSHALTPVVSALSLTRGAIVALNRVRPGVSLVGFSFTISIAARARISLARRVRSRGRVRWQLLPHSFTVAAAMGRNSRHLRGRGALVPGEYRLTVAPVSGRAQSIVFLIG